MSCLPNCFRGQKQGNGKESDSNRRSTIIFVGGVYALRKESPDEREHTRTRKGHVYTLLYVQDYIPVSIGSNMYTTM